MATGTVRLHRVFRTKPERVYRGFLDASAMAKWLPPYGFTCTVHHMDARVGGTFKMSFTNFGTGNATRSAAPIASWCRMSAFATRQHRAIRNPGNDSGRDVLSRLAGIAGAACDAG